MNEAAAGFLARLRQRKLVQWAIAYVAFAFALLQGVDIVAQRFDWPASVERYLILALAIGFFVALVFAWYHGERGAQHVGSMEIMILALLLAIGGGFIWRFGAVAKAPHVVPATAVAPPPQAAKPPGLLVAATKIPEKSVAVLPFANESGKSDEQFFSDGLSEDLITALSQFAGLKVISRNSAFQFRDSKDSSTKIGKLLGVAHLLEGSVQRGGDEVRITATLVNAGDGSIVWSQRYDKPYKDLFKLQDAITQSVAGALKAKLLTAPGAVVQSDRPPSGNLAAYTTYLRGVTEYARVNEPGVRQAIDAFQSAVAIDPHYAAAWAALSRASARLGAAYLGGAAQQQAYAQARRASDEALQLAPDLAAAHSARGYYLAYIGSDWNGAQSEIRRALQLAPHDGDAKYLYGSVLATLGQCGRAVDLVQQALVTDPRNGNWYYALSQYLACDGRMADAEQAVQTSIALQPQGSSFHEWLATLAIVRGDAKAALAAAQQEPPGPWHDIAMALALQIGPDRAAADAALKHLIAQYADVGPYQIAEVYAVRKDPDNLFKWLEHAAAAHDPGVSYLLYDPLILRYRHDPRFAAFCKKVGLPTTTDAVAMK
jgi:TolB-like protein/Flp pilus assembly protein TadD